MNKFENRDYMLKETIRKLGITNVSENEISLAKAKILSLTDKQKEDLKASIGKEKLDELNKVLNSII